MAISPLGNIIHVNQNMQVQSVMQGNAQNRVDLQNFANMESFNDKLKQLEEVRPTEEISKIDKDRDNSGGKEQKKEENDQKQVDEKSEDDKVQTSFHLLDIKV